MLQKSKLLAVLLVLFAVVVRCEVEEIDELEIETIDEGEPEMDEPVIQI